MRSGQRVGIVDSSSAVYIRVGEDNNMLIGDSRQRIVDRFHPAGSQITFGIERVEMRVDGSLLPLVCTGDTYAAVGRRAGYGDDIEFLFILMESVNIPERSFIRAGYDNNQKALEEIAYDAVSKIIFEGSDAEMAAHRIGMKVVGMIQEYINQPFNFKPKSKITKATTNWPDNPLIETGRLRNSVTYSIEGLD
mgnify:CR=1 FL=1